MRIAILLVLLLPCQDADDLIFRVLRDEMTRATSRLKLEKSGPPYYVEYSVSEADGFGLTASFGALISERGGKSRHCSIDLRVGDATLDNTNFADGDSGGGTALTIEDDYDALRQELWLATDREYKQAVEQLEKKKAFLQENTVKDRPDDLSKEAPVVAIEPLAKLEVNRDAWKALVRKASAVFKEFPKVQKSIIYFSAGTQNTWFLNNEGFRNRQGTTRFSLAIAGMSQASDGMKFTDSELAFARSEAEMPTAEAAEKLARDLATRLTQLADAPRVEEYRGPILFEGPAAADFIAQTLPGQLGGSHEPLGAGNRRSGNQWREQIGQKVMPGFITVVSDPTAKEWKGAPLIGTYTVDDDGVRAQKVTLIEKGVLKTFCMSRIPTRQVKNSNGHSSEGSGQPSTIFIQSEKALSLPRLREKLAELGKDEGLKHVFVVRRMSNPAGASLDIASYFAAMMGGGGGGVNLMPPTMLYRVNLEDGKEELVRGARFGRLTLRILRDIDATGDDAKIYLPVTRGESPDNLICPSLLIKEIEINKPGTESEKTPAIPNPAFEK